MHSLQCTLCGRGQQEDRSILCNPGRSLIAFGHPILRSLPLPTKQQQQQQQNHKEELAKMLSRSNVMEWK